MKWACFSPYLDAGVFIPLDLFFAERVLSSEPVVKDEHMAFLAFLLVLSRQGHLAFPLQKLEEILPLIPAKHPYDAQQLAHWVRSAALSLPPCCEKIIRELDGVFYLQKNWANEDSIAFHILRLIHATPSVIPSGIELHNLSPLNAQQIESITHAADHSLSLLFGGPGTGKTYTAARLIQAFLSSDEEGKMRVIVAAPTGKAVAQLEANLRRILPEESRIRSGTCHALLGLKKNNLLENEPTVLFADVILIDECSMIDAPLFSRLLSSIVEGTRLVLIGDPDQLPSVEAGSIFADLVAAAQEGVGISFTELKTSLRSEREEILCFAEHLRTGESAKALEMLSSPHSDAIKWEELDLKDSSGHTVCSHLWKSYKERFPSFSAQEPIPGELMHTMDSFRLLSCMRQGHFGVDAINHFFAEQFLNEAVIDTWWAVPILIQRSDYGLQLYNGDTGILIRRMTQSLSLKDMTQEDYALFPDRKLKNDFRKIPALALPSFELGYCLSVHKSQGSEYDEVFILIPQGADVFGREILYTAVTRSKHFITCAGSLDVIEKVIQNSARKISGLSARLKQKINKRAEV